MQITYNEKDGYLKGKSDRKPSEYQIVKKGLKTDKILRFESQPSLDLIDSVKAKKTSLLLKKLSKNGGIKF